MKKAEDATKLNIRSLFKAEQKKTVDKEAPKEEKPVEIETVETITRRLKAEKAAKEAAEAKLLKAQPSSPSSIKITTPSGYVPPPFVPTDKYEPETQVVELGVDSQESEEKRKLQNRGRFVGINRVAGSSILDKKTKPFRKTEAIDPPVPKPDVSSIVFNLSNNLKTLGSNNNHNNNSTVPSESAPAFVPGFDPASQGGISWNDLKLDISSSIVGSAKRHTPNSTKAASVVEKEWKKGASDAANAELLGDDINENRVGDLEDPELTSNPDEDAEQVLETEHTWTESSTHAYFTPQAQQTGDEAAFWTEDGYPVYSGGEWYSMFSEIEVISRQLKLLQKLPEQMKKLQREVQEIEKNTKSIMKTGTVKDHEDGSGRVPEVNPARHTDRYVNIPVGTKVLVLTDSICSRMNGYKISSELKVCVRSYGGLTASEMATVISNIDEDVCYDLDYVFFHVGTNDLGAEEFPHVKSEFKHLIKRALKSFSNATIFMSAILPRYGSTRELNDRRELNALIASLAEKPGRLRFINASHHFVEREIDNTLRGDLYKRDYIHLTLKGMGVLAHAFRQELDNFVLQSDGGTPSKASYNSVVMANDYSDCAATYSQTVASHSGFQNTAPYHSGYGDRAAQSPTSASFTSAAASAGVHVTPPVPTVALATAGGAAMNPRQRISGRYTQYRR